MKLIDPNLEKKDKGNQSIPDFKGINFELWTKHSLNKTNLPPQGFATYRTRVLVPRNTKKFGIFYSQQFSAARLYVNGLLLSETGFISEDISKILNKRNNTIIYFDSEETELDIILQIGNKDLYQGGARADFLIGSKEGIEFYIIKNIVLEMLVFGLIFGASIYHFLFYLLNRKYFPFLLFSLMCGAFLIRLPFQNIKVFEFIYNEMSWANQIRILHLSNVAAITLGLFFLRSLVVYANKTAISKIIYALHIVGFLFGFFGTFLGEIYIYRVNLYYTLFFLPIYLFHSGYVVYLNFKEKATFYLLGVGFIGLGFFANLAIVLNYYGYQGGAVLLIGLLSFILTHSMALGRFFANALETRAKMMVEFSKKNEKDLNTQREDLQVMMHDSLGSELTDIQVYLERILSNESNSYNQTIIVPLHKRFQNIIKSFRNQLLFMEDLNTAYQDLFTGLNLTVLRRYSDADREVDFEISNQAFHKMKNATFKSKSNNPKSELFYLITEICTNDLKYGINESIWRLGVEKQNLTIFQTNTVKDFQENKETNLKSALTRVENLNGQITSRIFENKYEINILIPLKD